ncbi:HSP20-like domain-containing protein [Desulfonema limicola]|uniref:HSP20-like domain-containing protein n=1 Tax=Desulfonema limicola TaxID=45656 RepID=A0A975B7L8_9BACT|nr:HSP20-like domain-containing protein [Desulfonema limicola]
MLFFIIDKIIFIFIILLKRKNDFSKHGISIYDLRIDINKGKKDITIKAEIPGIEADDIEVYLDHRTAC